MCRLRLRRGRTSPRSAPRQVPERRERPTKVQAGDTPRSIAQKTGVSERALVERNKLDPTRLRDRANAIPAERRQGSGCAAGGGSE